MLTPRRRRRCAGELVDGGGDLSAGGPCEYFFDLIYLTAAAQILGCFTSYAYYVFLTFPLLIGALAYSKLAPMLGMLGKMSGKGGDAAAAGSGDKRKAAKLN